MSTKIKVKPLADRVVIAPVEEVEKMQGGIVLPENAKEKPQQGKVVAVGSGRVLDSGERIAPEVKEGDTIVYAKYSGDDVKIDGVEYKIIEERSILAVL